MKFAEILATLEATEHLQSLTLTHANGHVEIIENKPGSQGSVKVYHYLWKKHGSINTKAAKEGLKLYAEHSDDALANPGKHPNIDRLLEVLETNAELTVNAS
ncbi:MAG: DUF2322 family protein [Methylophilales bacterium]|nr:DUF2322 family protein [Methylophilales bacterium]